MSFKFTSQKLLSGLFEPEGIYLTPPAEGELAVVQAWGDHADYYGEWRYNGVPVKGHTGMDFRIAAGAKILAADAGRVVEIGIERGGFERYMKIEHRWGESFYANMGDSLVEAGQSVTRGEVIGTAETGSGRDTFLHFAIRVHPFNRYDGWGGFCDPLPYLPPASVILPDDTGDETRTALPPHPMTEERQGLRRP